MSGFKFKKYNNHLERGNVLFLILIGVALFAALAYAVTSSGRSTSTDIDDEKMDLLASEIVQQVVSIKAAVERLLITDQCDITELSFERPPFDGSDASRVNTGSPNDFSCHVYHPNGGGVNWQGVPDEADGSTAAEYFPYAIPLEGVGTSNHDLTMRTGALSRDICVAINDIYGGINFSGQHKPPNAVFYNATGVFKGNPDSPNNSSLKANQVDTTGMRAFCSKRTSGAGQDYFYFYVLVAR